MWKEKKRIKGGEDERKREGDEKGKDRERQETV
jgi:hypothetical protein